ncbi:valine--tRNA ligase [Candidatus Woesearchaeota archaeon]|nr:valine--tRNA ligase [Candidatus Woesearchaeota archaeon]
MELPNNYNAKEVEAKWQRFWEQEKVYRFDSESDKEVFSIDVPPPYASAGHLHIGHALHYTQFEIIARFRRMAGYNVHFAPCFDNNGLPTEKYVEEKFKISKKDISRAEFRKLCLEESREVEKAYADRVFKFLGHSYDWGLLYTTIDPEAQRVAQVSFIDLYEKGDAYRAEEPTLWCTKHQTALAQAEIEDLERTTKLNYIDFDLEDGKKINVATTRPEFLPACVGIFIHPNDERYTALVGKKVTVPLFKQKVDVMADEKVDMDFGSGIVMICTFGDATDIVWWKKHKLQLRICVTEDGKLNGLAGKYAGLKLAEARQKMLEDLEAEGRITGREPLQQTVGTCWRCNTPLEFLVTKQWFIKTLDYKEELINYGKKIKWHPEFFRVRFDDWTRNLAWDWCISRQRFYGVPIPVWYCKKCGKIMMPEKTELPIDPLVDKPTRKCECGSKEFVPDEDVFDTWMTSSMSPEIAVRWLEKPDEFKKMFPTSLRVQSSDIIRTWAFYTILKAYLHFREIPWREIAIGTFVLDPKGRGMHKSKGNAIWTEDLLSKYNVDTVRYWVGTATWGHDLAFQEKELIRGNKFLTKLWNASKFCISHLQDYDKEEVKNLELLDKWMLIKINKAVSEATKEFMNYNTSVARKTVEELFWHAFCDNYLEIIKDRLYNPKIRGEQKRKSAQYTLYYTLLSLIKLVAPIIPHITEEIYQSFFIQKEGDKSIHISEWPKFETKFVDEEAEKIGDLAVEAISQVRQYKSENKKSLKEPVKLVLPEKDKESYKKVLDDLKAATHAEDITFGKELQINF